MRNALIPRTTDVWDLLERPFGRWLPANRLWGEGRGLFVPDVDVKDEKERIVVKADIPGIKKEDLSISVKEDLLTIRGERKEAQEKKEKGYTYSERFEGSFVRTVGLPATVRASEVKASYKDGVLEITLPKDENAKPKEVKVQIQ
jgi:HSP20 family protein